jgi:hypothetical protein
MNQVWIDGQVASAVEIGRQAPEEFAVFSLRVEEPFWDAAGRLRCKVSCLPIRVSGPNPARLTFLQPGDLLGVRGLLRRGSGNRSEPFIEARELEFHHRPLPSYR